MQGDQAWKSSALILPIPSGSSIYPALWDHDTHCNEGNILGNTNAVVGLSAFLNSP